MKISFVLFRQKNATSGNKALTLNYLNEEINKDDISWVHLLRRPERSKVIMIMINDSNTGKLSCAIHPENILRNFPQWKLVITEKTKSFLPIFFLSSCFSLIFSLLYNSVSSPSSNSQYSASVFALTSLPPP